MTLPIGTPDWQRTQPGASKVLYSTPNLNASTQVLGPFFCGSFSSIAVYMKLAGSRTFLHPHFYTDALETVDLGGEEWIAEDNGIMMINVPVRSPWCTFAFGPTSGSPALTGPVALIGINSSTDASVMRAPQTMINQAAVAVGAGVTVTFTAPRTVDGSGMWVVHTALVTWDATLAAINFSGLDEPVARMNQDTRISGLTVPLPHGAARMSFKNNTAGAGTVDLSLYAGRT